MVFLDEWNEVYLEYVCIDMDYDFLDEYLLEFLVFMFLMIYKEFGDVINGKEVIFDNYYDIFDGFLIFE